MCSGLYLLILSPYLAPPPFPFLHTTSLFSVSESVSFFAIFTSLFFSFHIYVMSYSICLLCLTYFTEHKI